MYALLALLAATSASVSAGVVGLPDTDQIRVSLNGGDYRPGDQVKVEVTADDDGHLLVLRVDGDGYVRVLFPLDPDLDTYVRGGRRYALRGFDDDASFLADDRGGTGIVLSVLSRERFSFAGYATANGLRWDYDRLRLADPAGDAEAQLLDLVDIMTDRGAFDYDAIGYRVWGPGFESDQPVVVAGTGWGGDPYFDNCLACGWRSPGWSISIGSRWYDPWYDPWYGNGNRWGSYPYGGYNGWGSGWNGWYGWDPYWGTPYRPITVINTPLRPVVPNPIYGTRARVPQGGIAPATGIGRRLSDPVTRPTPTRVGDNAGTTRSRGGTTTPVTTTRPAATSTPPGRATTSPPPVESDRSRARRPATATGAPVAGTATPPPTPRVQERGEERPVYRPPTATTTPRRAPVEREANPGTRPVSSPPPRREATPPPKQSSAPPRREATPPPRQSSPPPRQSSPPPAPRPSSPPPSTSRSSPPPPPPTSSGTTRSRSRGPDLR